MNPHDRIAIGDLPDLFLASCVAFVVKDGLRTILILKSGILVQISSCISVCNDFSNPLALDIGCGDLFGCS